MGEYVIYQYFKSWNRIFRLGSVGRMIVEGAYCMVELRCDMGSG